MNKKILVIAVVTIAIIFAGLYIAGFSGVMKYQVGDIAISDPSSSPITSPTQTPTPTATPTLQPTATISAPTPTPKPYDFKVTYQQIEGNSTTITLQVIFSDGEGQVVTVNNSEIILTIFENGVELGRASSQIYASESTIIVNQDAYTTKFVFQLSDFAIEKEASLPVSYGMDVGILHASSV